MCRGRRPHSSTAWPAARERHSDKRRLQKISGKYFNGTVEYNSDIFTTDNSKHIIRLTMFSQIFIFQIKPSEEKLVFRMGDPVSWIGDPGFPNGRPGFPHVGPGFPKVGPRFWVGIIICFIVAFRRKKNLIRLYLKSQKDTTTTVNHLPHIRWAYHI